MVSRRDALPRADVPVRLRHGGLAVHVPRPGELPDLRGPAGARDRPPRAVRLGLHERQSGHRSRGDRRVGPSCSASVPGSTSRTGTSSTAAGAPRCEETIDELAALEVPDLPDIEDEAVVTEGRGIGSTPHAARRVQPPAREHRPHLAVPLRVPEPRVRRLPRVLRALQAELPRHRRPDDRQDGQRHRRRAVPARQRAQAPGWARARAVDRRRRRGRRRPRTSLAQSLSASAAGREWLADWESRQAAVVSLLKRQRLLPPPPLVERRSRRPARTSAATTSAPAGGRGHLPSVGRRSRAERDRITAEYRGAARRRGRRRIRPEPRARPDGVPVRREPQLLRRALVPHALLEQGPRVRRAARAPRLPRRPGGHLLPAAQRGLRRARGPAACVGGRIGGPRHAATGRRSWRARKQIMDAMRALHAAARARRGARGDHRADDDHAVGHHHRAGARVGGRRSAVQARP